MNIKEFKEGDLVTRNEPCNGDFSYNGSRLELVGVENGMIFLVDTKDNYVHASPVDLEVVRGWDEGWIAYPESLYQKAKQRIAEMFASKGGSAAPPLQ